MPEKLPPPITLAMIVCDAIWVEPLSGKASLLGLFSEFAAETFPAIYPLMAVYICMTDAHGKVPVELRLVDADEEHEPLLRVEDELDFSDRRAIMEWEVQMENVEFPAPGNYRLQFIASGEFLLERRLTIHQMED
jgi:hypothetical protein